MITQQEEAAKVPHVITLDRIPRYQRGFVFNKRREWVFWRTISRVSFYSYLYDSGLLKESSNPDDVDVLLISGMRFADGRNVFRARNV